MCKYFNAGPLLTRDPDRPRETRSGLQIDFQPRRELVEVEEVDYSRVGHAAQQLELSAKIFVVVRQHAHGRDLPGRVPILVRQLLLSMFGEPAPLWRIER